MNHSILKIIYSNPKYLILSIVISVCFFIPLSIISEYIFLSPYLVMHIPFDGIFGFALIVTISVLSGIVISMNVYRIRLLQQSKTKMGGSLFGSIIGASAGTCCGPVGFAVISTFGTVGGVAIAFLSNYEILLRLVSIGILIATYYVTVKALGTECKIQK